MEDLPIAVAIAAVFITFFVMIFTTVQNTSDNNHKTSIACVKAGGDWIDGKKCTQ